VRICLSVQDSTDEYLTEQSSRLEKTYSKTLDDIIQEIKNRGYYISEHLLNDKGRVAIDSDITNRIETKKQNGK